MKTEIESSFLLGENWLYYKIYTGVSTSDRILIEIVKPVTEFLLESNIIDKWFFIRYEDPQAHLRLRFHCKNLDNIGTVINCLRPYFREFLNHDLISKILTDTYERELKRYGAKNMIFIEELFFYESKLITNFLHISENSHSDDLRWLFSLNLVDIILDAFGLELENKLLLLEKLKIHFAKEFGMSRPLKKQLDDKFRKHREKIVSFLSDKNSIYMEEEVVFLLEDYKTIIASVISSIKLTNEKDDDVDFDDLLVSLVHMAMNRMFKSKNRLYEMVCYDFLYRYYKSSLVKSNLMLIESND